MSTLTIFGILCVVIALVEVATAFGLGIAAQRRGGGLAVGAVTTAICGVVAWQAGTAAPPYVAIVAQVVALASLATLLAARGRCSTAPVDRSMRRPAHHGS